MNYFISDLHLGHKNSLKFDNRPFDTIEEQDKFIIENWNKTITNEDDVYILGDFSWYKAAKTIEIYSKLNGKKHLIVGNHDHKLLKCKEIKDLFVEIVDYKELYINKSTAIVLCHYPILFYRNAHRGWYHFYGHLHNDNYYNMILKFQNEIKDNEKENSDYNDDDYDYNNGKIIVKDNNINNIVNMFNVGAMLNYMNYIPKTFDEIINADIGNNKNNYNNNNNNYNYNNKN